MEGINCLKLLTDGDREGLSCLYKLFSPQLFRYGLSICGNEDEVGECLQDLFIYLWENKEKLTNINNPKAYLITSFRRRLIRQLEKGNKIESFDTKYEYKLSDKSVEDQIISAESDDEYLDKLRSAMAQLSEREREVIHLKYFQQYKNEEISELLSINYQSVRNLLYRAIQNLRKKL